jgi:hypothetical protein
MQVCISSPGSLLGLENKGTWFQADTCSAVLPVGCCRRPPERDHPQVIRDVLPTTCLAKERCAHNVTVGT